jgi:hypothetical protein
MRISFIFHALVIFIILLIAFAPLMGVVWVGFVADANGCKVDEGSPHPCIVDGKDIGQDLYTVGVMGWLMIATIPLGLIAVGIYLAIVVIYYLVRRAWRARGAVGENSM